MCELSATGNYDDEGFEAISDRTVRGRKDYRCQICDVPIPAGSYHHVMVTKYEGEVSTERMHLQCRNLADRSYGYWDSMLETAIFDRARMTDDHHQASADLWRAWDSVLRFGHRILTRGQE